MPEGFRPRGNRIIAAIFGVCAVILSMMVVLAAGSTVDQVRPVGVADLQAGRVKLHRAAPRSP